MSDGFRFDLAPALARAPFDWSDRAGFLQAIAQDPILSRVKLIAEAWDLGSGGYRVGGFPTGWGDWNDRFRDTARAFWRGDRGQLANLASRLSGSSDIFNHSGRKPWASIQFVASHDGFHVARRRKLQQSAQYAQRRKQQGRTRTKLFAKFRGPRVPRRMRRSSICAIDKSGTCSQRHCCPSARR